METNNHTALPCDVEALAREMKAPVEIACEAAAHIKRIATPPGWTLHERNDAEAITGLPVRKTASVDLNDADSFIDYVLRHGYPGDSTVWCQANYKLGKVAFQAIINDHGSTEVQPNWRDHVARFTPVFSTEWDSWTKTNGPAWTFSQVEFASLIEDSMRDFASAEGFPTGAQMLEMALSFEANQDMRFKSAVRLQSGGEWMSFVQDDDNQTLEKMQLFERFSIGIPVFWNGDAYRLDARLRYRVREGVLKFWYELIRPEKVLEAATKTLIQNIKDKTGNPFFFGNPFATR